MTFDLKSHLAEIRIGRAELERERAELHDKLSALDDEKDELEQKVAAINQELEAIDELNLDSVLGPAPVRQSGVLKFVAKVVNELHGPVADNIGRYLSEGNIIRHVMEAEPQFKDSSIRSALARMVERNDLVREGTRGARTYRRPREGEILETVPEKPSEADERKDVRTTVLEALQAAGDSGLTRHELAWVTGDAATIDRVILESPEIETRIDGAGITHCHVKPDALGQASLFDGADPPPEHANR